MMKKVLFLISFCLSGWMMAEAQSLYQFRDTTLTDDQRIEHLMSVLTLDEKIALLSTDLGVPRLGIPHCGHYEGLHGLTRGGSGGWGDRERTPEGEWIKKSLPTTVFPQSYGLGSTWDRALLQKVGEQTAEEARYYMQSDASKQHALVMRAPNADLARDPRWGRTEESFGEDPFLTGELTVAHIRGLQGDHPRYWKTASLMKHFLANSNEDGRDSTSSNFDNRLFHEYYAYPFRKGIIEGGSSSFMAAYNAWNGTVMMVHPCLENIARKQWGAKGIICTDGSALKLLIDAHKAYSTLAEGASAAVKATIGQFLDNYDAAIREGLEKGLVTEQDIDKAIRGNLYVALKLGLLDGEKTSNPYINIGRDHQQPSFLKETSQQLVREITAKSVVLLKNEAQGGEKLLPLRKEKLRKIAVIGPYADQIVQDWYSGTPPYEVTILEGIRNAVGSEVEVVYALNNRMGEAVRAAADADVAIVCVGNHPYGTRTDWKFCPVPSDGREAVDRQSLMLPDEDLVKLVYQANPNTILALVSSFPYTINWSQEHVPAIVHLTHCSQEQGNGLADVLFGQVNPAGRTVQTWVKDITQLPDMMDYDIRKGRTYMYHQGEVLYPFGYGLSYTTFEYQKISQLKQDKDNLYIKVRIKNTGAIDGEEVPQLYVNYPESKVDRPSKQLRAFSRIPIKAGKTVEVEWTVPKSELAYWDEAAQTFVVESGKIILQIGSSSADIRLKEEISVNR